MSIEDKTIKQLSNSIKVLQKANSEIAEAYDKLKDEYENRLKADMVAMLTEIQLEIEEEKTNTEHLHYDELEQAENYNNGIDNCNDIIQQKINSLKSESEDKKG